MDEFNMTPLSAIGVARPVPVRMPSVDLEALRPPNMAEYAIKAIYEEIADFEAQLDADHELGMPIVGGPAGLC